MHPVLSKRDNELTKVRKDADNGSTNDQYKLAMILHSNDLEAHAFKYFVLSAEGGHKEAQYELARLYETGGIVPTDKVRAAEWYKKAADQGHEEAIAIVNETDTEDREKLRDSMEHTLKGLIELATALEAQNIKHKLASAIKKDIDNIVENKKYRDLLDKS